VGIGLVILRKNDVDDVSKDARLEKTDLRYVVRVGEPGWVYFVLQDAS
jgi:hypothetical protein